jgi:hypothetical protein
LSVRVGIAILVKGQLLEIKDQDKDNRIGSVTVSKLA